MIKLPKVRDGVWCDAAIGPMLCCPKATRRASPTYLCPKLPPFPLQHANSSHAYYAPHSSICARTGSCLLPQIKPEFNRTAFCAFWTKVRHPHGRTSWSDSDEPRSGVTRCFSPGASLFSRSYPFSLSQYSTVAALPGLKPFIPSKIWAT